MSETAQNIRDWTLLLLAFLAIVVGGTALAGHQFRSDCNDNGGTFSATTTLWKCTY